jgi:hypothetical protein
MKVISYKDITKLKTHKDFNLIKDTLHICAAASTTEGMYNRYGEEFNAPIISIGEITDYLTGDWNDSITKLAQYTRLTREIKILSSQFKNSPNFKEKYEKLFRGIRKNQREIMDSIRSLVECNAYPEDFVAKTIEEKFFVELWDRVETNNSEKSILKFRNEFYSNLNDKDIFKKKLIKAIQEATTKTINDLNKKGDERKATKYKKYLSNLDEFNLPKKIVFHGFYFIRPIQDRIMSLIENLGIEVIFLNLYNHNYNKIFNIWDQTFDESFGHPSKRLWVVDNQELEYSYGKLFADIYEGKLDEKYVNDICLNNKITVNYYQDVMSFVDDCDASINYYSPDSRKINNILRDYYPERYKNRHFLSYPIGQFLYKIHTMWDEYTSQLKLDMDSIQSCFSSGWLTINLNGKKFNARNYSYDLYSISSYFKGCITINQWRERLNTLKEVKSKVVNKMNTSIDIENKNYRYHQMAANPFMQFSFFKIEEESIDIIHMFIEKLIEIANKLFEKNEELDLNHYLKKIDTLIEESDFEYVNDIEKDIIGKLRETLKKDTADKIMCFPEDIAEGLILLLGGDFEKNEKEDYSNLGQLVLPIENIEASPITHKENELVHICQLSEESMPGGSTSFTWPLNENNINRIIENTKRIHTDKLLRRMLLIKKEVGLINRYLFYCTLQSNKNIQLSWIKKWEDKELEESVYIKLLESWRDDLKIARKEKTLNVEKNLDINDKNENSFSKEELSILGNTCILEYKVCPRRFYYSYVANDFSTYNIDFHHGFLYTNIVRSIASSINSTNYMVHNHMKDFFPQWSDIEKKQLKEYLNYKTLPKDYEEYDGKMYISNKDRIYFLQWDYKSKMVTTDILKDEDIQKETKGIIFEGRQNKGINCMYCPHREYCNVAILPLDKEDEDD